MSIDIYYIPNDKINFTLKKIDNVVTFNMVEASGSQS